MFGFSFLTLFIWAVFLIGQNASFTFVSRARNSGSYLLHVQAACCSNAVYMMTFFVSFDLVQKVLHGGTLAQKAFIIVYYTLWTVCGSVLMHWISKNFIETNAKRKVGG